MALIAATVLLAMTGCAGGSGDRVTLRFWAMGREGEVVQELVHDFEREHPSIRVIVQQIPWSAAHEKLLTSYVGRATPDVAQLGNTWISEFGALRALEPLRPWLAQSAALDSSRFFAGIWDTNVLRGEPFGVPWYVDTRVLFYRSDLLARAGYDHMPEDWAGWHAALKAMKGVMEPGQFPIFLPINEWNPPVIFGLQAGSPLLQEGDTRGAFSGDAFRGAFEFYLSLFRDGLAPPVSNSEIANVYQEFERGRIAMYITGPWNLGEFKRRLPPEMQSSWATAALPGPTGAASGVSLAGGSSLVVFRESKHKAEAWALIEFLSRPEQQLRFYHLTGDLPARREAWQDTTFTRDVTTRAFREQLERVVSTPKVPEWEQVTSRVIDQVETAIRGGVSPDSALAALDRDADRILEKRRWLVERERRRARPVAMGVRP